MNKYRDYVTLQFAKGDHLVVDRIIYTHHGIYIGNGEVIHFNSTIKTKMSAVICKTTLEDFAKGQTIEVIPHTNRPYSRKESVRRAKSYVGKKGYNLITNNCEHFVNHCIEGVKKSDQVNSAINCLTEIAQVTLKVIFTDEPVTLGIPYYNEF